MPDTTHQAPVAMLDPLARRLFSAALLRGRFTLRSGAVSDRYFDKYRVTNEPSLLGPIAERFAEIVLAQAPDAARIVAPELGAVPLAAALALRTNLPFAIVRSAAKAHGTGNRIEGPLVPGEQALLVEDVVTSGGAALEAIEVARDAGVQVRIALCMLDRGEGGREALASVDVTLHALLDATQLEAAFDAGLGVDTRTT